ncbi:hypothetical protein WDU94_000226 [Cyamophila willieti]
MVSTDFLVVLLIAVALVRAIGFEDLFRTHKTKSEEYDEEDVNKTLADLTTTPAPPNPYHFPPGLNDRDIQMLKALVLRLRREIDRGTVPPFLEKVIAKAVENGRGVELKDDKEFYEKSFGRDVQPENSWSEW